jgi:hypothetical protein
MTRSSNSTPAGHPSIVTPTAGPWLSPNVVILNIDPNVFPGMRFLFDHEVCAEDPAAFLRFRVNNRVSVVVLAADSFHSRFVAHVHLAPASAEAARASNPSDFSVHFDVSVRMTDGMFAGGTDSVFCASSEAA